MKRIEDNIDEAGLFRTKPTAYDVLILRQSLESENGIPEGTSIHVVAHTLLQWLYELPEPLLGYDLYHALLSCEDMDEAQHRVRNLTLLVQEAPWYAHALLCRVVDIFSKALSPSHRAKNGLSGVHASVITTPFLMRKRAEGKVTGGGWMGGREGGRKSGLMNLDELDRYRHTHTFSYTHLHTHTLHTYTYTYIT